MINQSETRNWFTIWRYLGGMQYPSVRRWCLVLSYLPNVLGCLQVDSTSIANSQGTSKCTCPGKNMPLAMGLPTKKNMLLDLGFPSSDGKFQGINYWSENNITLLVSRKSHQRYIYKQCTLIRINSHTHISLLLTIIILLQLLLLWLLLLLLDIIIYYTTVLHIYIYIHTSVVFPIRIVNN